MSPENTTDTGSARIIDLPKVEEERGKLTFMEANRHIPFVVNRVFYMYDVPDGEERGGHALRSCHQVLIPISGSFHVTVDDGTARQEYDLNRAYKGLYLPPMVWRQMSNFSTGAVCLVLASDYYDADAYYRDYDEYKAAMATLRGEA